MSDIVSESNIQYLSPNHIAATYRLTVHWGSFKQSLYNFSYDRVLTDSLAQMFEMLKSSRVYVQGNVRASSLRFRHPSRTSVRGESFYIIIPIVDDIIFSLIYSNEQYIYSRFCSAILTHYLNRRRPMSINIKLWKRA